MIIAAPRPSPTETASDGISRVSCAPPSWTVTTVPGQPPRELEYRVPGLVLRESRRFGDLPAPVRSRLPMSQRLGLRLVSRLAPAVGADRLNLFDLHPTENKE